VVLPWSVVFKESYWCGGGGGGACGSGVGSKKVVFVLTHSFWEYGVLCVVWCVLCISAVCVV
jgi:hypothetical protein